jgi:2'-5' RNA ligase superfamily protein
VHSIELLLDPDTEDTVRGLWDELARAGLPSQADHTSPSNRPHVTLAVAESISPAVDDLLAGIAARLPMRCVIGAPLLFGTGKRALARLAVPSAELLLMQAEVALTSLEHMRPGPVGHTLPGSWTPHVTLCRRLTSADVAAALDVVSGDDITGTFAGLRRWDGTARVDHLIG